MWTVVGGEGKGGILVREGRELNSKKCDEKLSTGARILELEVSGERLKYELVDGTGPNVGWVAMKVGEKELVVKVEEDEEEGGEAFGPGEIPRQLRPAREIAAVGLKPVEVLKPFWPAAGVKEAKERVKLRRTGDLYGLPFPVNPQEFESQEYGAAWLTRAFHAAGTLAEDNAVARIATTRNFPGGGSGPKTLFTVEYGKPDESLDTALFMKLPAEVGLVGSGTSSPQQRVMDIQGAFGDIWGAEIQFYRFVAPFVPFAVPKFYFGDLSRESHEACTINAAVDWPRKGRRRFGAYQVLPPCEKCEDYTLQSSQDYYFALLRQLGLVAGLAKVGGLGPDLGRISWSPYGPDARGLPEGMCEHFKIFVQEVAPHIWPASVRSEEFLGRLGQFASLCQQAAVPIQHYIHSDPLYIGFGHQNGNSDNAYFYRNAEGAMEAGIFDWGSAGHMPYATEFAGAFGSCLGDMFAEYDDRLMHAFADAYHSTGAPELDVDELILHLRLTMSVNACQMLGSVLPWLSQKHPQGRPFWREVKAYNDEKIRENFSLKFGFGMLYNKVVLMSLRGDVYAESMRAWAKRMESKRGAAQ